VISVTFRAVNTFTGTVPSAGLHLSEFSYGYQVCSSKYVPCAKSVMFCRRSLPTCSLHFRKRTAVLIN